MVERNWTQSEPEDITRQLGGRLAGWSKYIKVTFILFHHLFFTSSGTCQHVKNPGFGTSSLATAGFEAPTSASAWMLLARWPFKKFILIYPDMKHDWTWLEQLDKLTFVHFRTHFFRLDVLFLWSSWLLLLKSSSESPFFNHYSTLAGDN